MRIDAMDEGYVIPIREFFSINGCQTFVNASPTLSCTYHIIAGDYEFVKKILGTYHIHGEKVLLLLWQTEYERAQEFIRSDRKILLVDPTNISPQLLNTIMNIFFVGSTKIEDLQTTPYQKQSIPLETYAKNNPNLRDQFIQKSEVEKIENEQRIQKTVQSVYKPTNQQKPMVSKRLTKKTGRKKIIGVCILVLFALPILFYGIGNITTPYFLKLGASCIAKQNSCTSSWTRYADKSLILANTGLQILEFPIRIIAPSFSTEPEHTLLAVYEKIITIETSLNRISTQVTPLIMSWKNIGSLLEENTSNVLALEQIKIELLTLHTHVDVTHALMEKIQKHPPIFIRTLPAEPFLEKGIQIIDDLQSAIVTAERVLLLYPYISGYKSPYTFLILLQNNMELRPTGGFIGSFMKLTITEGKMTNMEIQDIYTIDGQLKGHVDPPEPIRDILKQEHWYLRDSNWNPDFIESAKRALWFYEKETGETANAVIALNASLIAKILEVTGPIQLSDSGDVIDATNFFSKSLQYTQEDFFPGSTQKKDFLGTLLSGILTQLVKQNAPMALFRLLKAALDSHDIQLYLQEREPQQLVTQFSWLATIPENTRCAYEDADSCIQLPHIFNEANLGVNKANYFVSRKDLRHIEIEENGRLTETITRTIRNTSKDEQGSGLYRMYMRAFVPRDAHITLFRINDVSVPKKGTGKNTSLLLPYGELDTISHPSYTVIGLAADTKQGGESVIEIRYERDITALIKKNQFNVSVYTQKQPGIDTIPTTTRITYPTSWQAIPANGGSPTLANNGFLEYNSTMFESDAFAVTFIKD